MRSSFLKAARKNCFHNTLQKAKILPVLGQFFQKFFQKTFSL